MKRFTDERKHSERDEIWIVQHPPVFTLGQAGREEHLLDPGKIPVLKSDRGGQVTYHGPGQLVIYLMLDLRRLKVGVRALVSAIEESVIELLSDFQVQGLARQDAPGVYVKGKKIASLGLRVRKGCSYHGLSLNLNMDLTPYRRINVCGYPGLAVTQLADWVAEMPAEQIIEDKLVTHLVNKLGYMAAKETKMVDDG